jgi:hypothetical protein
MDAPSSWSQAANLRGKNHGGGGSDFERQYCKCHALEHAGMASSQGLSDTFKLYRDKSFVEKLKNVVGLYLLSLV